MKVRVQALVHPTEDPERVLKAVLQLFPDSRAVFDGHTVHGRSTNINMLLKKAGDERVLDAARGAMWRGRIDENGTRFELNKQAAFMGRVNFNEIRHPLGDVVVRIEGMPLDALLDRVSPATAAEIAFREGHAKKRAAIHREEHELETLGRRIDDGFDELDAESDDLAAADEGDELEEASSGAEPDSSAGAAPPSVGAKE